MTSDKLVWDSICTCILVLILVLPSIVSRWRFIVRRNRFSLRPLLSDDEWLRQFAPKNEDARDYFLKMIQALSRDTGIPWQQYRPGDTLFDIAGHGILGTFSCSLFDFSDSLIDEPLTIPQQEQLPLMGDTDLLPYLEMLSMYASDHIVGSV